MPHQLCFINTIRQGASALSRSFRMLSYEDFKDGVRMANRSITAIKKIAEEQSELLLNAIKDDGDDGDGDGDADGDGDGDGDVGDRINDSAVRDDVMKPMLEFNNNDNNDIHTASMLHGRSHHHHHHQDNHQRISTTGTNLSRPSTSLDASSAQEQREATIMMTIASDDDRGSTVAATVADDDVGDDYDTPSIYEYLQPKPKETSVVEQQQQVPTTAKSRNPFYRPNTTAATDPHPNLTDPSLIKELGPPLKSMIINNTVE